VDPDHARCRARAGLSASTVPKDAAGRATTARLLHAAHRPTANMYTSDVVALAGVGVAHEPGINVPGDVSIVDSTTRHWPR
jgi:DNA-binding LacI/PurR family transcriptional regulator